MANQSFSADFVIKVDGSPLRAELKTLLTEAYVEDNRAIPDVFELRFSRNVIKAAGFTIGAEVSIAVKPSDRPAPVVVMVGEVVGLEAEWSAHGNVTVIRGMDHSHRLFHRHVAAYPELSVAEIVRQVAQRANLKVGHVDDVEDFCGDEDTQLSQDGESDWALLQRLAALVGAECAVVEGKLEFRIPQPPDGAPDASSSAQTDPLVLEMGHNLISLQAGVSAVGQPANIEVRGWDLKAKEAVVGTAPIATTSAEVTAYPPDKLASAFDAPDLVTADWPVYSSAAATVVAEAYADRVAAGAVNCFGVARGNPSLIAGAKVRLANLGAPFDMTCVLSRSRHRFSPHEKYWYTTEFEVAGRSDRSLFGVVSGGVGSGSGSTGVPGAALVSGEIADVNDPLHLGRVKLSFPWLSDDYTSGWARTAFVGAGSKRGMFWLPEVGDEVVVGFDRGDFDSPFVLGGLYNGKDKPQEFSSAPIDDNSGEIVHRGIRGRTGHQIVFSETSSGPDEIRLETGDNKYKFILDKKNTEITVNSDGTVTVKAKKGVTIDAGTGALELKGKSVDISGNSVSIGSKSGAKIDFDGQGGTTVAGKPIKLN